MDDFNLSELSTEYIAEPSTGFLLTYVSELLT